MADNKEEKEIKTESGVNESKLTARLEFERKFNLGNYESETLKIMIEGPYNDIKDGKDLPRLLLPTWRNMVVLTEKVQARAKPEDVAKPKEAGKVEVVEQGKGTPPPPPVKKNANDDI